MGEFCRICLWSFGNLTVDVAELRCRFKEVHIRLTLGEILGNAETSKGGLPEATALTRQFVEAVKLLAYSEVSFIDNRG